MKKPLIQFVKFEEQDILTASSAEFIPKNNPVLYLTLEGIQKYNAMFTDDMNLDEKYYKKGREVKYTFYRFEPNLIDEETNTYLISSGQDDEPDLWTNFKGDEEVYWNIRYFLEGNNGQ